MHLNIWKEKLELGIDVLDEQHFEFFKQANKFLIEVKFGLNKQACLESMSFLEYYLFSHFHQEFAFMKESGYPKYREHQASHDMLKIKTKAMFLKMEEQNYSDEVLEEFAKFLEEWIEKHILEEDYDFVQYYKSLDESQK